MNGQIMKSSVLIYTPGRSVAVRTVIACSVLLLVGVASSVTSRAVAQPHRVVATVGEDVDITIQDIVQYLQLRDDLVYSMSRADARRAALDILIAQRLKQIDFFARGYHDDPAFKESVSRIVTEELVLAYGEERYENRYLNEERIREEHDLMGRRVIYSEWVVDKSSDMTPEQLRLLRQEIRTGRDAIESGASLQDAERRLRREMPIATSRVREGRLTWQETVTSPRNLLIFRSEPGEVRSFEGPNSISVVRVDQFEPRTVRPLEDVREEIVEALQGWYAQAATDAFRGEWTSVIDAGSTQWSTEAVQQIGRWARTSGFLSGDYRSIVPQYVRANGDLTIVSDGMAQLQLSELPRVFDNVLILSEGGSYTEDVIRDFVLEAIRTEEIANRARAIGLEADILTPNTPSPGLRNAFIRFYNQRHVDAQVPAATDNRLRAFYQQHVDSMFYQLRSANIQIIERSTREEIDSIWEEIQRGVRFEVASSRRLNRVYRINSDGEVVSNVRSEPAYFADIAFDLEEGDVAGPVAFETVEGDTRYAIIRSGSQREARRLPFEEVEDRVRQEYLTYHRQRVEDELRVELADKYGVQVFDDVLAGYLNRGS